MKEGSQNPYVMDKLLGDCKFQQYKSGIVTVTCCEGQIGKGCNTQHGGCTDLAIDAGKYKVIGERYDLAKPFQSSVQELTVGNAGPTTTTTTLPPNSMQCTKEDYRSWICQSAEGSKLQCTRDTTASQLTWNCEIIS